MLKQSKELTKFYNQYNAWLEAGANTDQFSKAVGLCSNLDSWAYHLHNRNQREALIAELQTQFVEAGLDDLLPFNGMFNKAGRFYSDEVRCHETHLNPKRIAWVKEHING